MSIKPKSPVKSYDELESRYFQLAALRTQPFIITFFQAIMTFKKLAKLVKLRYNVSRIKHKRHRISKIRTEINKANNDRIQASFGRPAAFTANFSKRAPRGTIFVKKEIASVVETTSKIQLRNIDSTIYMKVAKKIEKFNLDVLNNRTTGAGEMLKRRLKIRAIAKSATGPVVPTSDLDNLVAKNNSLTLQQAIEETQRVFLLKSPHHMDHRKNEAFKTPQAGGPKAGRNAMKSAQDSVSSSDDEKEVQVADVIPQDEVLEYLPGTAIYFGAQVALQARHGGFLSYHNAQEIKASAHKILSQSRYLVVNSEDLTDIGIMKYGDAVWLQAGSNEVLGAQYGGGPIVAEQTRKIHPALINFRRENIFKAQQYGRWVILNRSDPTGTIGQPVLHYDKIMLEQEWYFLASATPYESSMFKRIGMDDLDDPKIRLDLFSPNDECIWKIHLVALPSEDKADELQRLKLLLSAQDQIDDSKITRKEKASKLLGSLSDLLHINNQKQEMLLKYELKHKLAPWLNNKNLVSKHEEFIRNKWEPKVDSVEYLRSVYGKTSNIVQYRNYVDKMREEKFVVKMTPVDTLLAFQPQIPKTKLQRLEDRYWNVAQKLSIDTRSVCEMPTSMAKYYGWDQVKKIAAAKILQRAVRNYLQGKFTFKRGMNFIDTAIQSRLVEKAKTKRRLLREHAAAIKAAEGLHQLHVDTTTLNISAEALMDDDDSASGSEGEEGGDGATADGDNGQAADQNQADKADAAQHHRDRHRSVIGTIPFLNKALLGPKKIHNPLLNLKVRSRADGAKAGVISDISPAAAAAVGSAGAMTSEAVTVTATAITSTATLSAANQRGTSEHHQVPPLTQQAGKASRSVSFTPHRLQEVHEVSSSSKPGNATRTEDNDDDDDGNVVECDDEDAWDDIEIANGKADQSLSVAHEPMARVQSAIEFRRPRSRVLQALPMNRASSAPLIAHIESTSNPIVPTTTEGVKSTVRPQSATLNKKALTLASQAHTRSKLQRTPNRDFGLPPDVFEDQHEDVNLVTGMRFLRAISSRPDIYSDVSVVKRRVNSAPSSRRATNKPPVPVYSASRK